MPFSLGSHRKFFALSNYTVYMSNSNHASHPTLIKYFFRYNNDYLKLKQGKRQIMYIIWVENNIEFIIFPTLSSFMLNIRRVKITA